MWWDDTGLSFVPPSPNIRNLDAAILYPGVGAFEATNVAVGRGTKQPFRYLGAPWIDGKALADRLNFWNLPGFDIKPVRFTPKDDIYKGEVCKGIKISVTNRDDARPLDLFVHVFTILTEQYPDHFKPRWDEVARVTGSNELKKLTEMGQSAETILVILHEKAAAFEKSRKPYLLYE